MWHTTSSYQNVPLEYSTELYFAEKYNTTTAELATAVQSRRAYSSQPEFAPSLLNLRLGEILRCEKHPDADKLYVSQIQIEKSASDGEKVARTVQVCSGLVNYIPVDQMQNRRVVVLTNLKPSKMRGVKSEAMLLAAEETNGESTTVELINPPKSALVGAKLTFDGFPSDSEPPRLKPKAWEAIQSHLKTNTKGEAIYLAEDGTEHLLRALESSEPAKSDTL
ncbi:predicted protein, partial [Scheffersomyces stipitis CBS 6054]